MKISRKRCRTVQAKAGELRAAYGRDFHSGDVDLFYANGGEGADKADARVLANALEGVEVYDGKNLREVLIERGYDITTLKFSIQQSAS